MKKEHVQGSSGSIAFRPTSETRARWLCAVTIERFAVVAFLAFAMLFTASRANAAGCANPLRAPAAPFAAPAHADSDDLPGQPATIVGLWHVIYTATYAQNFPPPPAPPLPFQFLESYKTWHGDGTEFENAFLPPTGGNICFGVWRNLGRNTVKLHHIGLMFDPVTGAVTNVFTVDEIDTVSGNGETYQGMFDLKLFDASDVLGTGTPIAEVKGTTAATRIAVD